MPHPWSLLLLTTAETMHVVVGCGADMELDGIGYLPTRRDPADAPQTRAVSIPCAGYGARCCTRRWRGPPRPRTSASPSGPPWRSSAEPSPARPTTARWGGRTPATTGSRGSPGGTGVGMRGAGPQGAGRVQARAPVPVPMRGNPKVRVALTRSSTAAASARSAPPARSPRFAPSSPPMGKAAPATGRGSMPANMIEVAHRARDRALVRTISEPGPGPPTASFEGVAAARPRPDAPPTRPEAPAIRSPARPARSPRAGA